MRTITSIVYNSFRDDFLDLWLFLRLVFNAPKCKYCGTRMIPSKIEGMMRGLFKAYTGTSVRKWPVLWTCDECQARLTAVPGKAENWAEPRPTTPDAN